jgi:hypothetical protein
MDKIRESLYVRGMSLLSDTRRSMYRTASFLGDVEAVASGSPTKVGKRILRKSIWRQFGRIMRGILR